MRTHPVLLTVLLAALGVLAGCAAEPPRYGEVVTMKAGEASNAEHPGLGTVWRLDEKDLKALSPRPIVPAPPPPNLPPPPRPNAGHPPPVYYPSPYPGSGYY